MSPSKLSPGVVFGLPALLFVLLAWKLNFLCDDAFISFRYARNWVEGQGLCYEPGRQPPVEGYSNLLWVLAMGPFSALGLDLGSAARSVSALCGLLLSVWVTRHARERFELDDWGALCTGLFFVSLPCSALWATGGLATMPAALLAFGVYERLFGDPQRPRGSAAGALGAAAVLLRADGILWVFLILLGGGIHWLRAGRDSRLAREALRALCIVACVSVAHFLWRHHYYGEWWPNTARVKTGLSRFRIERGWNYLAQWWLSLPSIALVLVLSLRRVRSAWRGSVVIALTVAAGAQAYALWVGGDFMPFGRLMYGAVPFVALLFGALWARLQAERHTLRPLTLGLGSLLVLANVLACFDINVVPDSQRSRFHFRLSSPWQSELAKRASMAQRTAEWTQLGRAMALHSGPADSIVLSAIGAVGYYSRITIYDRFGLVSPEVLEHSVPLEQASPGHDRAVSTSFFFPRHPTLGGTFLAPRKAPLSYGMPPAWDQNPLSQHMRLERYPLPAGEGFAPDSELRMMIHVSWPAAGTRQPKSP